MGVTDFGETMQSSKSGKWYFSCDEGEKGILVGIQEPDKWRCPVVGMVQYKVELDQLNRLHRTGFPTTGDEESYGITITPFSVWEEIIGEDLSDEWAAGSGVAWFSPEPADEDIYIIIRLHFAFE